MTGVKLKRTKVERQALEQFDQSRFKNNFFQAGVVDGRLRYPDGTKVVDVATWNEFGTATAPARPALRNALKEAAPQLRALGQRQAALILQGRLTIQKASENQAKILVKLMKFHILKLKAPPNAPSTVAAKGFNDPLIETGKYHDSINYKVAKSKT